MSQLNDRENWARKTDLPPLLRFANSIISKDSKTNPNNFY